jgi:hypothetical protein
MVLAVKEGARRGGATGLKPIPINTKADRHLWLSHGPQTDFGAGGKSLRHQQSDSGSAIARQNRVSRRIMRADCCTRFTVALSCDAPLLPCFDDEAASSPAFMLLLTSCRINWRVIILTSLFMSCLDEDMPDGEDTVKCGYFQDAG